MDTVDRIFLRIKALGMEQKIFAERLGVRAQIVTDWKKRTTTSYTKRLPEIAEILETSVDYLLYGEEKKPAPNPKNEGGPDEESLMAAFWGGDKDLSPEDMSAMWADVKKFAAFIAEKRKQEKQDND